MLKKHKSLLQNAAAILVLTGVVLYLLSIFEVSQTILFSIGGTVLFVVTFSVTVRITFTSGDDDNPPKSKPQKPLPPEAPADHKATMNDMDQSLLLFSTISMFLLPVFVTASLPSIAKLRGETQIWNIPLEGPLSGVLIMLSIIAIPVVIVLALLVLAAFARMFLGQEAFYRQLRHFKD